MGQIYSQAIQTIVWLGLSQADCEALAKVEQFITSQAEDWEMQSWRTAFRESRYAMHDKAFLTRIDNGLPVSRDTLALEALRDGSSGDPRFEFPTEDYFEPWKQLLQRWQRTINKDGLLIRFAASDYWERAWIVQELMLSSEIGILCSSRLISLTELLPLALNLLQHMRECPDYGVEAVALLRMQHTIFSVTRDIRPLPSPIIEEPGPKRLHFAEAIRLTASRLCSDIRDRVFSIMSLVKNGETFKIDYKQTIDQLLASVLTFHTRHRGPDLIIQRVLPLLLENTANTLDVKLPSPDKLPGLVAFLGRDRDASGTGHEPFWAKTSIRDGSDFSIEQKFTHSFCLPVDICGRLGVFEFCFSQEVLLTCFKDVLWWSKQSGRWMSKVAGIDPDDLD